MDKRHNNVCVCNYISIYLYFKNIRLEALLKRVSRLFCLFVSSGRLHYSGEYYRKNNIYWMQI